MFYAKAMLYDELLTLKLLDDATLHSKNEVLEVYENNKEDENLENLLYEKSVYPNGEKLGFYNISKFTLNDFINKNLPQSEFENYLKGFSKEINELFSIHKPKYYLFKDEKFLKTIPEFKKNIATTQENISNYFLDNRSPNYYIDFNEYSNFLINTLFEGINFKENISILDIEPENILIFNCLHFIKDKNPKCNVNLSVISRNDFAIFPLKFLAIINKINLNYLIIPELRGNDKKKIINEFFNHGTKFDFILNEPVLQVRKEFLSSTYNVVSSSREIYRTSFGETFINKEWLEKDILESLIVIPEKAMTRTETRKTLYSLDMLIVLNHNKPPERKNKCILIDNTKNKQLNTKEYTFKKYKSFLENERVYEKSYKLFSNFEDSKNSAVISYEKLIRKSKECQEGFIINLNDLLYENKMASQKNYFKIDIVDENHINTKQLNYDINKLSNLIKSENIESIDSESFESQKYLFFLTKYFFTEKWVFYYSEINNPNLYNIVKLNSDKISLEYLYYYLNSQIGIKEYEYFRRGSVSTSPFFEKIRVAVPPKEIQDKIVETMNKSEELFEGMKQLKNNINENFFNYEANLNTVNKFFGKREYTEETQEITMPDNWLYAYRGLIWPLAISYLIATSGGFEKTEKANNLLRLFEFTTAFNAYVLISGIPEDVYERRKHKIWNYAYDKSKNDEKFKEKLKLTFGSWFTFHLKINDIYKKNFETEINKDFYLELLNQKIRDLYEKTLNARNNEFHDGIVNAHEAESFLKELNSPKLEIFNYLNSCYKNLRLYYNFNSNNAKKDGKIIIEHNVMFLNGPYSMPIYTTIEGEELLDPETLYLHDVENNTFAKLDDRLIKFEAMDEHKHDWRLYVFVGFETDEERHKRRIHRLK